MNRFLGHSFSPSASIVVRSAWVRAAYPSVVLLALASASITTMAEDFIDTDSALHRCPVPGLRADASCLAK